MPFEKVLFQASDNLFGLYPEDCEFEDAKVVVMPVPYDSTTSYRAGTRGGPRAILEASRQIELYDLELKCEPVLEGIHVLPPLEPDMRGPQYTLANIEKATDEILKASKMPLMLGGEHSITAGVIKSFKNNFKGEFSVLQLDAHSDLRDSYEGSPFNHACVMRRVVEMVPAVQIGIRNTSAEEANFIEEKGLNNIIYASEMLDDSWQDRALSALRENVYLTIDLDAFDPSIMPAVGTPEPGGMLWYPTLDFLKRLVFEKNIIGFDVVELAPIPGDISSDFMAAKLIFKILAYWFTKQNQSKCTAA